MELSGDEINILATFIASKLACDMSQQDLCTLRILVGQIHCCLGTIMAQNGRDNSKNTPKPRKN